MNYGKTYLSNFTNFNFTAMSPTRRKPNAMWALFSTVNPLLWKTRYSSTAVEFPLSMPRNRFLCRCLENISGCESTSNPKSAASLFDFNEKKGARRVSHAQSHALGALCPDRRDAPHIGSRKRLIFLYPCGLRLSA